MTHFPPFFYSTVMLMGLPQWGQVREVPCWVESLKNEQTFTPMALASLCNVSTVGLALLTILDIEDCLTSRPSNSCIFALKDSSVQPLSLIVFFIFIYYIIH